MKSIILLASAIVFVRNVSAQTETQLGIFKNTNGIKITVFTI